MFIIELTYTADLAEVDRHMNAHMAFVRTYYASGHFLMSGRKVPRDGGIIITTGESRSEIERIAAEDPFCTRGVAPARVVEFRVSQKAEDIHKRMAE